MATTAGVILLLILSLVSLSIALPAGTCGTAHPIRPASGVGKAIPTCGRHECDDPAIRDQYLLNAASPMITINLNVVYFGVLAGSNLTRYNAQLAFFQREYGRHMNVTWSIHTTVVEDRYQVVNGSDRVLHAQIAKEFYIAGSPTVLWTTFNPNPDNLLGYAYYPQSLDFETAPELWYGIMDIKNALTPQGTTMLHEVGHMLGLFHTFTESCNPDRCPENINSPDLNVVGDFCSDTKPVWMSFDCDVLSTQDYDCNNVKYTTDLSQLPQDNYMAYTPDSCQDQFTPQQAARVRCYLDRLISFATVTPPGTSTSSPTASGTVPIKSPIKAPTTKAISVASRADVVAVLVGLVFVIVSL